MSKEYGITKRFEDLENRPQGGSQVVNYLFNTSFQVSNQENMYLQDEEESSNFIAFYRGTYDWDWQREVASLPPGTHIRSFSAKENIAMSNTRNYSFSTETYGSGFSTKWILTGLAIIDPHAWDGLPTLYSLRYEGAGVSVSINLLDSNGVIVKELASGESAYSDKVSIFSLAIPSVELVEGYQVEIRVDNRTTSDTSYLYDCQLEVYKDNPERILYVKGEYSDLGAVIDSTEMYWVADRLGGLEKYSYVEVNNLVPNSSFLNTEGVFPKYWGHLPEITESVVGGILSGSRSTTSRPPYHNPAQGYTVLDSNSILYMTKGDGRGGMQLLSKLRSSSSYLGNNNHNISFRLSAQQVKGDRGQIALHLYDINSPVDEIGDSNSQLLVLNVPHDLTKLDYQESNLNEEGYVGRSRYTVFYSLVGDWIQVNLVTRLRAFFNFNQSYTNQTLVGIALQNLTDMPYLITDVQVSEMLSDGYAMPIRYKLGPLSLPEQSTVEIEPDPRIGDLDDLNTVDKTTLVNAVNEVLAGHQGGIQEEVDPKVGDLSKLATNSKSNVVSALNEVFVDVDEGKRSIASALTDKQQPATGDETFNQLAQKIRDIVTGGGGDTVIKMPTVLSERSKPSMSYLPNGYDPSAPAKTPPTPSGLPLVVLTDDLTDPDVAVWYVHISRAVDYYFRYNKFKRDGTLEDRYPRRRVLLKHVSQFSSISNAKVLLLLKGNVSLASIGNSVLSAIQSKGINIPVFDVSGTYDTSSFKDSLLDTVLYPTKLPYYSADIDEKLASSTQIYKKFVGYRLPDYLRTDRTESLSKIFNETTITFNKPLDLYKTVSLTETDPYELQDIIVGTPFDRVAVRNEAGQIIDWQYKSPAITHSQSTTMTIKYRTPKSVASPLKVVYRVSSEGGFDFLEIWVNGVRQVQDSGEGSWSTLDMTMPADSDITLELKYTKDSSVSSNSDCAIFSTIKILKSVTTTDTANEVETMSRFYRISGKYPTTLGVAAMSMPSTTSSMIDSHAVLDDKNIYSTSYEREWLEELIEWGGSL